jgi:hypothetical protein
MAKEYKTISFPHAKGIVVSGDIHGDFTSLVYKCCVEYGMTDTLIIVAGDCGFGFESPIYYEPTEKVHNVKWINIRALLTGLLRKVKLLYIINVKCLCI